MICIRTLKSHNRHKIGIVLVLNIYLYSYRFGRKMTFVVAVSVGVCCNLLSALSNGYIMFTILRVFIGCFFFPTNVVGYTLSKYYKSNISFFFNSCSMFTHLSPNHNQIRLKTCWPSGLWKYRANQHRR